MVAHYIFVHVYLEMWTLHSVSIWHKWPLVVVLYSWQDTLLPTPLTTQERKSLEAELLGQPESILPL